VSAISEAFRNDNEIYFLVELDLQGLIKRYSTKGAIQVPNSGGDDLLFDGKLISIPTVSNTFDFHSFRYSNPQVRIEIINNDRFQDNEISRKLESGRGRIWVWSKSLDWSDIEDFPIFSGSIRKVTHNKDAYSCILIDFASTVYDYLDDYNVSNELPGDMIWNLLNRYTDIPGDYINRASFKDMNLILKGLVIDTLVDNRVAAFDLIDRILFQCLCARCQRYGQIAAVVFDINGPVIDKFYQHDYLNRTISIEKTPYEKVTNHLVISYDPTSNSPAVVTWATNDIEYDWSNNRKCAESYAEHGILPETKLYFSDCGHKGSAHYCANRYLEFFAFNHDLITIDFPYHRVFDLLEGSIAELNIEEGSDLNGDGWTDEKCILLDKSYLADRIKTHWWRINV